MANTTGFINSLATNTWYCFMSIFMEMMAMDWVPVIKQGGHRWWPIDK